MSFTQNFGNTDRDSYLRKRLAPEKIAEAAFARSSWSSFLPTIADSASKLTGGQPIFDTRTSSQPSDIWFGNPAFGLIDDVSKMAKGLTRPLVENRPRTAEDTRNLIRPLLWQNALPVTVLMNYLTHDMPSSPPRR